MGAEATNKCGLEIRKAFIAHRRGPVNERGPIRARLFPGIDVLLGFEMDLDGRGASIIGVLQQFTEHYSPAFIPPISTKTKEGVPVNSPEYLANILSMSARWFTSTDSSCPEFHCAQTCQIKVEGETAHTYQFILRVRRHS